MMKRYITGFDGLRTIGVIFVIGYHTLPNKFPGGYLGVIIFFVLSGYLVTSSLLRRQEKYKKLKVREFLSHKIKRLYPTMLCVFLASAIYMYFFQRSYLVGLRENFIASILSLQNWWQLLSGSSYFTNFTGLAAFKHVYFLSLEMQFIIVALLLITFFKKARFPHLERTIILGLLTLASAAVMAIFFVHSDPSRSYYGTDARLFSFLIGLAAAYLFPPTSQNHRNSSSPHNTRTARHKTRPARHKTRSAHPKSGTTKRWYEKKGKAYFVFILCFTAAIAMMFTVHDNSQFAYFGGMLLFSILSIIIILLIGNPALSINRIFTNPIFSYIGSRSYGIYLWQLPVFTFTAAKLVNPVTPLNLLWQCALILILSELSYRFIETPFKDITFTHIKDYLQNLEPFSKKILFIIPLALSIFSLIIIFSAPAVNKDESTLQKDIAANKAMIDAAQRDRIAEAERARSTPSPIPSPSDSRNYPPAIMQLAAQYGVTPAIAAQASTMPAIGIGDSVMLGASTGLTTLFPHIYIDAVVGRQTADGPRVLAAMPAAIFNNAQAIIVGLGANGTVTDANVSAMMDAAHGKQVYWLTVHAPARPWEAGDDQVLLNNQSRYPNLHIINWHDAAQNHPEWFVSDHIHPTGIGITNYARIIAEAAAKPQ